MRRGNYGKLTMLDRNGTSNPTGSAHRIGHQCTNHQTRSTKYGKAYHNQSAYDGGTNTFSKTQKYRNLRDIYHQTNVNNADNILNQKRILVTPKLATLLMHNPQE